MSEAQELYDKYPSAFRNAGVIQIPSGWYPLLEDLVCVLGFYRESKFETSQDEAGQSKFRNWVETTPTGFVILQAKEKFGELRVYYTVEDGFPAPPNKALLTVQTCEAAVRLAERVASRTCMETGLPGTFRSTGGYLRVMCDEADAQYLARRAQWDK